MEKGSKGGREGHWTTPHLEALSDIPVGVSQSRTKRTILRAVVGEESGGGKHNVIYKEQSRENRSEGKGGIKEIGEGVNKSVKKLQREDRSLEEPSKFG